MCAGGSLNLELTVDDGVGPPVFLFGLFVCFFPGFIFYFMFINFSPGFWGGFAQVLFFLACVRIRARSVPEELQSCMAGRRASGPSFA